MTTSLAPMQHRPFGGPIEPGHLRIESRLIDEDRALGIPLRLLAMPPQIGFGLRIQRTFSGVFLIFALRQLIEAS